MSAESGDYIRDISSAPSAVRRRAQEKQRRIAELDETMAQYYAKNPSVEVEQRRDRIAALGLRAIDGQKRP